jgi:hypothetical protein
VSCHRFFAVAVLGRPICPSDCRRANSISIAKGNFEHLLPTIIASRCTASITARAGFVGSLRACTHKSAMQVSGIGACRLSKVCTPVRCIALGKCAVAISYSGAMPVLTTSIYDGLPPGKIEHLLASADRHMPGTLPAWLAPHGEVPKMMLEPQVVRSVATDAA